eukprot:5694869-Pyramimonas_sp.AAC.1
MGASTFGKKDASIFNLAAPNLREEKEREGEIATGAPPAMSDKCPENPTAQFRNSCRSAFASPAAP